jgi:predicted type IV restriction endonuclease
MAITPMTIDLNGELPSVEVSLDVSPRAADDRVSDLYQQIASAALIGSDRDGIATLSNCAKELVQYVNPKGAINIAMSLGVSASDITRVLIYLGEDERANEFANSLPGRVAEKETALKRQMRITLQDILETDFARGEEVPYTAEEMVRVAIAYTTSLEREAAFFHIFRKLVQSGHYESARLMTLMIPDGEKDVSLRNLSRILIEFDDVQKATLVTRAIYDGETRKAALEDIITFASGIPERKAREAALLTISQVLEEYGSAANNALGK